MFMPLITWGLICAFDLGDTGAQFHAVRHVARWRQWPMLFTHARAPTHIIVADDDVPTFQHWA